MNKKLKEQLIYMSRKNDNEIYDQLVNEMSNELLMNGEDLDQQDGDGYTAIACAAVNDDEVKVNILLNKGANPLIKINNGDSAIDISSSLNCTNVLPLFKAFIAKAENEFKKKQKTVWSKWIPLITEVEKKQAIHDYCEILRIEYIKKLKSEDCPKALTGCFSLNEDLEKDLCCAVTSESDENLKAENIDQKQVMKVSKLDKQRKAKEEAEERAKNAAITLKNQKKELREAKRKSEEDVRARARTDSAIDLPDENWGGNETQTVAYVENHVLNSEALQSEHESIQDESDRFQNIASWRAAILSMKHFRQESEQLSRYLYTSNAAVNETLTAIVSQRLNIPTLYYLMSVKRKTWDTLNNMSSAIFSNSLRLMIVCPITLKVVPRSDKKEDDVGWVVKEPKKWLKKWGPALLIGLKAFHAALQTGALLGIPLPSLPTEALKKAVSENEILTKALNKMLEALTDMSMQDGAEWGKQLVQDGMANDLDSLDLERKGILRLSGESYNAIETFLTTGENAQLGTLRAQLDGRMGPIRGEDGVVEWVSTEGQEAWYEDHKFPDDGVETQASLLTSCETITNNSALTNPPLSRPSQAMTENSESAAKLDMTWVGDAFENEGISVTTEQLQIFERILFRNEIYSKKDLTILTYDEFVTDIVNSHVDELMPRVRKKKFECLHSCVTKGVAGVNRPVSSMSLCLQQEVMEQKEIINRLQTDMKMCQKVNLNDIASKKKVENLQRKLDAIFESTVVGHGNQVQDVVTTKQGATISIVNPKADEQMAEQRLLLLQLQEEFDSFRAEMESEARKK